MLKYLGVLAAAISLLGTPSAPPKPDRLTIQNSPRAQLQAAVPIQEQAKTFWERTTADPVAAYTGVLALLTFGLVAVSAIQIYFLKRAEVAGKDALIHSQRAFVYLDGFEHVINTQADGQTTQDFTIAQLMSAPNGGEQRLYATYFSLNPRWKNSGSTPTKKLNVSVGWIAARFPGLVDFDYPYRGSAIPMFLGPHAVELGERIEIPPGIINGIVNGGAPQKIEDQTRLFIWGRAQYRNIFDLRSWHHSQWCYEVVFSAPAGGRLRADFIQWGPYNQSDEDGRPYNLSHNA